MTWTQALKRIVIVAAVSASFAGIGAERAGEAPATAAETR